MDARELAARFFIDARREQQAKNEETLSAWLWFSCPAAMRQDVESAIRNDPRWSGLNGNH